MQLYKFWTSATAQATSRADGHEKEIEIECFGYSNTSLADALAVAQQRANAAARRHAAGETLQRNEDYYEKGPIREEIIEQFHHDSGQEMATITRNSYGCLILNTPDVFFADVDLPPKPGSGSIVSFFSSMFRKKQDGDQEPEGSRVAVSIRNAVRNDPSLLIRLYRTLMGFRIMVVSRLIPADDPYSAQLLEQLGADRLYSSLCKSQDCYRARLTPKPWRCSYVRPGIRFPYATEEKQKRIDQWVTEYEKRAAEFATCHLIAQFGSAMENPVAMKVAQLHDHYSLKEDAALA